MVGSVMLVSTLIATLCVAFSVPKPQVFEQVSDHFLSPGFNQVVVPQRYWVVDEYWRDGPVFLYLCGQQECPDLDPHSLYPIVVAKQEHALFIALEHRFYGQSMPAAIGSRQQVLPNSLDVKETLGDIATFIVHMNAKLKLDKAWVVLGSGYSGALAAWFRTRYPSLAAAAWASSATIQPLLDFPDFDAQVARSLSLSGSHCVDTIRGMNEWATSMYESGEIDRVASAFGADKTFRNDQDKRTVLWMVADAVAKLVESGRRSELCESAENAKPADALDTVATLVKVFITQKYELVGPSDYSSEANKGLTRGDGSRQRYWQSCAQLGWYQTASAIPLRSHLLTHSFFQQFCTAIFPYPNLSPELPASLDYLGSKIVFTNGVEDPWQWVSYRGPDLPDQEVYSLMIDCPGCSHSADFWTPSDDDNPALQSARSQILALLEQWIR